MVNLMTISIVIKLTIFPLGSCQEREPQFLIMFKLRKFLIWLTNLVRDFPSLAQNTEKLSTCFSSHHPTGTIHNSVTFQRSGCLPIFWWIIWNHHNLEVYDFKLLVPRALAFILCHESQTPKLLWVLIVFTHGNSLRWMTNL